MQIIIHTNDLYWVTLALQLFKRDYHWKYSWRSGNVNLHLDGCGLFTGLGTQGSSDGVTNLPNVPVSHVLCLELWNGCNICKILCSQWTHHWLYIWEALCVLFISASMQNACTLLIATLRQQNANKWHEGLKPQMTYPLQDVSAWAHSLCQHVHAS